MAEKTKGTTPKTSSPKSSLPGILGGVGGVFIVLAILFFIAPEPKHTQGFETLVEVVADADSKEELAPPESLKDHRRPSWKTYYGKTTPGFFGKKTDALLSWLGVKKRPSWDASYFVHLLEKRIKEREEKGLSAKYEYVRRIVPTEKSRIIVWGDLTGAYHSMVRGLKKLHSLDIIGEDLKLKNKDDYILLTGDAAARSPFIMELLTLIMKLEEQNPGRMLYITGNNERRGSWYTYGLREALEMRAKHLEKDKPLYKVAEHYFETLPLAVYASIPPHNTNEFVRFSHFAQEVPTKETYREFVEILDDSYYSSELLKNRKEGESTVVKLSKTRGEPDPDPVNVRITLKSYRKTKEYQKNFGLRFLVPDKNATAWAAISSPTIFVHKILKFYNDAFSIIQCGKRVEDWTITLYTRDMREKKEFETMTYNFLTGKSLTGGADLQAAEEIKKKKKGKAPEKDTKK